MKTFREFLCEMPKLIHSVSLDSMKGDVKLKNAFGGDKLSKLPHKMPSGYLIYHRKPPHDRYAGAFVAVHPKTKVLHAEMFGSFEGGSHPHRFRISWAAKHKDAPFKMAEMSHTLITKQGIELQSDNEQSPGSAHHWKALSEMPGIHMSRLLYGEEVPLHKGKDWYKNYFNTEGHASTFLARRAK